MFMKHKASNDYMVSKKFYLFIVLVFLTLFTPAAMAQQKLKFYVESFVENQFDTSARDKVTEKYDGNGDRYSIIKVTSSNPDDDLMAYNFDFGYMQSIAEVRDNQIWVYVQRNAKHVTISRNGYIPVRNYNLRTTIQEGKVYEMSLSVTQPTVYKQMVQFNIKPAEPGIIIMYKSSDPNSQEKPFGATDANGSVAKSLELGTYTYKIHSDNYRISEGRIMLNDHKTVHVENVILISDYSNVTLMTSEGSEILIDGQSMGVGYWSGTLSSGYYKIECRKENHRTTITDVHIIEERDTIIELESPSPITGTLSLTSDPLGAYISIDGKEYGTTPQNIEGLSVGEHKISVTKANHKTENRTVTIKENEITELHVEFKEYTNVSILSKPSGASLYIDEKFVGTTPVNAEIETGEHQLKITKKRHFDFDDKVTFSSSNPKVQIPLKRLYQHKSSIYAQANIQIGSFYAINTCIGGYVNNINIEAFVSFNDDEELVYLFQEGGDSSGWEFKVTSKIVGAKFGYGFIFGKRIRLTPQIGFGELFIENPKDYSTSALTLSVGMRSEWALGHIYGLTLTPEYSMAVIKEDGFKALSAASSVIKGWATGFNLRLGIYLYF